MAAQTEIAELIKNIQADVTTIVRGELALAKEELLPAGKSVGAGAGLFGAAGYLALVGAATLFTAIGFAWSIGFQAWFRLDLLPALWWGFAVDAVMVFVLAGVAALVGRAMVKKANFTPEATIASVNDTVAAVKSAAAASAEHAAELPLLGHAPLPPERDELTDRVS